MNRAFWFAGIAPLACASAFCAPGSAMASTAGFADAVQSVEAAGGVLVFAPAFFSDYRPNTAFDMIGRLPGFGLNVGDSNTRGLSGSGGNVLIDGVRPSAKSDPLDEILRRISAVNVDHVELIRGGAPGIDMQGQPVVANVVLKRNVQVERVVEANTYVYADGYLGPLIKGQYSRREGDNQIEGSISANSDRTGETTHGERRRFDGTGAPLQTADLDRWDHIVDITATGGLQRSAGGGKLRLNGLLGWFTQDKTQDILVRSGAGPDEATQEHATQNRGELGADWTRTLGPRTELQLTGLERASRDTYAGFSDSAGQTTDFAVSSTSGESISRAVLRFRPSARWAFEGGGEAAYNYLDSTTAYAENGAAIPLPNAAVKVEELRGEGFAQTTWKASRTLNVEAGLKVEVSKISQTGDTNQSKSFVYPKPRLQLTWTPAEGHQLQLLVERTVGQLDFGQFVASSEINLGSVNGGNADLEPEKSTTYQLTYERRFWDKGVLELTALHTAITDAIDVIPLAGGFEAVGNIGNGTLDQGTARLTLPLDRFGAPNARIQVRGTWARARIIDPVTGQSRPFSNSQDFGCGVSASQDLAGGRWSYGVEHGCNVDRSSMYRVREVRDVAAEPFILVYGQWKPSSTLTLRVDLGNVGDMERYVRRSIHAGPRNSSPLALIDERRTKAGPWIYLQIRKSV